jgi:hypothetical protein
MVLAKLTVDFSGAYHLNYTTLGDFICLTFYNCPHLAVSGIGVVARPPNVQVCPDLAVVAFFVEKDCQGELAYTTDPTQASGSHAFNLGPFGKAIRSLMVLENSQRATGGIVSECFSGLNGLLEDTNATNSSSGSNASTGEDTVAFLPISDENLTSNWLDPIPSDNASLSLG